MGGKTHESFAPSDFYLNQDVPGLERIYRKDPVGGKTPLSFAPYVFFPNQNLQDPPSRVVKHESRKFSKYQPTTDMSPWVSHRISLNPSSYNPVSSVLPFLSTRRAPYFASA